MSKRMRERVARLEKPGHTEATNGAAPPVLLKLDLGCGPNKRAGFLGVDRIAFPGVDARSDLSRRTWFFAEGSLPGLVRDREGVRGCWPVLAGAGPLEWKLPDASVDEVHSSHFLEHLTAPERCHFANELYRVLVPGGKATLIVPHWASCRAYGDPTHQWPPVSEFWFYYVLRAWRTQNAPHTDAQHLPGGFACDFDATWGYSLHPEIQLKAQEAQQFAMNFYKESCQDLIATLTRRP